MSLAIHNAVSTTLTAAGFPTRLLAIAFSCYSDASYSLSRLSIAEFGGDPRFLPHGMGAVLADADENARSHAAFTTSPDHLLAELRRVYGPRLEGLTVVAHDAQFAAFVLARRFQTPARHVLCARFLAQALHAGPRGREDLGDLARRHGHVRRAPPAVHGLRHLAVPQLEAVRRSTLVDAELVLSLARRLVPVLPGAAGELKVLCQTIRMFAERGLRLDVSGATSLLKAVEEALANRDETEASEGSLVQTAARLRRMIHVAGLCGGVIPAQLEYLGAHTGRFTSAGVNLQNLPHRVQGPARRIRALLTAPEAHVLVVVDAAQIEARILAWLAGETTIVSAFLEGRDIYSEFSTGVFGRPVRKPAATDSEDVASELKPLREIGKQAVVGLGYGMGARRFFDTIAAIDAGEVLIAKGSFTRETAERVVAHYRSSYRSIPELWARLESALRQALEDGAEHAPYHCEGRDVVAVLPSGRELRYRGLRLNKGLRLIPAGVDAEGRPAAVPSAGTWVTDATGAEMHGGILVENLVQALARDLLAAAVVRLEEFGHEVALHVHDEIVLIAPMALAQKALEDAIRELSRDPEWDPDRGPLPLRAEGHIQTNYMKDSPVSTQRRETSPNPVERPGAAEEGRRDRLDGGFRSNVAPQGPEKPSTPACAESPKTVVDGVSIGSAKADESTHATSPIEDLLARLGLTSSVSDDDW